MAESVIPNETEQRLLAGLPMFAGIDPEVLSELATHLKRRTYRRGEVIYHREDPPGSLFIVSRGIVKMQLDSSVGKRLTIGWVAKGNFFGTISVFGEILRPENAVALEPCELFVLNRDAFRSFLRSHPAAGEAFMAIMAARWRHALERLHDVAFLDVQTRLAKTLLDFSHRDALTEPTEPDVIQKLTQLELAALIVTRRETVSKWLHYFARRQWIAFDRGRIRILQADALRRLSSQ